MHKNGRFFRKLFDAKMDRRKINKHGGSNKGMADGFFFFCKINRRGATFIRYLRVCNTQDVYFRQTFIGEKTVHLQA